MIWRGVWCDGEKGGVGNVKTGSCVEHRKFCCIILGSKMLQVHAMKAD